MGVVRDKIEEEFFVIYRQAERIATSLDVSPSVPRTVSRQMHQSNISANIPEEHYRRVLAIPVLDTFIAEMEFRFNELNQRASTLLTLIPSIITKPDYHGETMADLIWSFPQWSTKFWYCWSRVVFMEEWRVFSIASNILWVQEKFFSNEEITKLAKKKYENRLISLSCTNNLHRDIAVDYDEVARLFFQLHSRKINQKNL